MYSGLCQCGAAAGILAGASAGPVGQAAKTSPSHGENRGSIPLQTAVVFKDGPTRKKFVKSYFANFFLCMKREGTKKMRALIDKRCGRSFLKGVAMIAMVCDHTAYELVSANEYPNLYNIMRIIGRIAFPIFCYLLVEGFVHTSSRKNYMARLAVFAILSEVPYNLMIDGHFFCSGYQNVMWTLLIGFFVLCFFDAHQNRPFFQFFAWIAGCAAAFCFKTDYGFYGVLIIGLFYLLRQNGAYMYILMSIVLLLQGGKNSFAVLSIPFIMAYDPKKNDLRLPKYFFYIFYPAHMLALFLIKTLLLGGGFA